MRRLLGQVVYDEPIPAFDETAQAVYPVPLAERLDSRRYRYVKRSFDVVCAVLMSIVFLLPCLLIAVLIRLTSRYPVFYSEERVGRNGVSFRIWKFRSMRPHSAIWHDSTSHAEATVLQWRIQKRRHDPRVTAVGRFLRRWSLDELPQLYNVLRGEMSLIGPRPVVEAELHFYKHLLPYYLAAAPGLSGLWQISGRSNLGFSERAELDALYVQNWSLKADLIILFQTIPAVLGRVGAR
jgi:lipopolysaccharide/colanic/teichoic acid biosynthesis glycosyltransferase